jgi:hypothetical protein
VSFDELTPYPVRRFTYRNEQVRVDEVQGVFVYELFVYLKEKNEVGGACSTYGGGESCVEGFGGETWRKETAWETQD